MAFQVFLDTNIQKQLKTLRKAGGRTSLVADHAESVMERVALTTEWDLKQTGRRTRNGEVRIKNCIKFDLVDGHRLLGIRQGEDIIFLYIGTHDECDRWIRNGSGLRSFLKGRYAETVTLKQIVSYAHKEEEEPESDADAYEDCLTTDLDEKTLRKVFRGLTGE